MVWDVCVDIFNRYNGEYSEEMKPFVEFMAKNRVVVRLDVDRVRSWDHRKLGMPAMELGGSTADFIEWTPTRCDERGMPRDAPRAPRRRGDGCSTRCGTTRAGRGSR